MSTVKNINIQNSASTYDSRDIGAEAQYVDVSRDSSGDIIPDITASGVIVSSTEGLSTTLKNAEDRIDLQENELGAKNLLPNNATSQVYNGITYTVNSDGSVTASGTASGGYWSRLYIYDSYESTLSKGNFEIKNNVSYKISGCPSGGSSTTFSFCFAYRVGDTWKTSRDSGSGNTFTFSDVESSVRTQVYIEIQDGESVNGTFYPMIRPIGTDDTYVPYAKTNKELTEDCKALEPIQNILGSKNLLPSSWDFSNAAPVVFNINTDGTITVNSSVTVPAGRACNIKVRFTLPAGTYILNGCPSGGAFGNYSISVTNDPDITYALDFGEGAEFTLSTDTLVTVYVGFYSGYTLSGTYVFKPMIRPVGTDATYVPYAMVNRDLTTGITDINKNIGVENMLPLDLEYIKSINTEGTWNNNIYTYGGLTFTVTRSYVKVNGTATDNPVKLFLINNEPSSSYLHFNGCILTGCPSNGSLNTVDKYGIYMYKAKLSSLPSAECANDIGNGSIIQNITNDNRIFMAYVYVFAGQTVSDLMFYPKVRYAITNEELTKEKADKKDLTNIRIQGQKNNTGSMIYEDTYFYLNNVITRAKADIANNASLTNSNCETVTAGALNNLQSKNWTLLTSSAVSASSFTLSQLKYYRYHEYLVIFGNVANDPWWKYSVVITNNKNGYCSHIYIPCHASWARYFTIGINTWDDKPFNGSTFTDDNVTTDAYVQVYAR